MTLTPPDDIMPAPLDAPRDSPAASPRPGAKNKEVFSVSAREGGWQVARESDHSTVSIHPTLTAATEHARSLAYEHHAEYAIHGADGKVISRDRLGRDSSLPPATTVNMFEARNSFMRLLERVEAGEEIIITRQGAAIARLGPVK